MKRTTTTRLIALVCLVAMGHQLSACSSAPAIPTQGEKRVYRSTGDGPDEAKGEGGADEAKPSEPVAVQRGDGPPKAMGPVAQVEGKAIGADAFNAQVRQLLASGRVDEKMLWELRAQLVENLVNQELLDQAVENANFDIGEDAIDAKLAEARADFELFKKMNPGSPVTFEQMLASLGMDPASPRDGFAKAIAIERLLAARGYTKPSEEELRAFYESNTERFSAPERARASHILFKVDASAPDDEVEKRRAEALEIMKLARAEGADFGALAREHSEGPSGPGGGDLGFFTRDKMVKPFADAVWDMKVDEVSEPVRTQFGWHIIKKVEYQAAGPVPFDTIREPLSRQLAAQRFQVALKSYLEEIRAEAKVELMLENIK